MEENISIIKSVGIKEREEIIVDFARWLETASKEALVYGEGKFAMVSASMAEAMRSMPTNLLAISLKRPRGCCSRPAL